MNIKKIIAPTMSEAVQKVKRELGENAVILHSKEIYNGGFLGMFRKKNFEVIAVLDEHTIKPSPRSYKNANVINLSQTDKLVDNDTSKVNEDILDELAKLREEMKLYHLDHTWSKYPDVIQNKIQVLKSAGVHESYLVEIADNLFEKWQQSTNASQEDILDEICSQIIETELGKYSFDPIANANKIIHFVGPTGVGKTTTIAKLAAEAVLDYKKKVAFITTDTYRIAAIEQIKTYAELLQIPIEVVYEKEDFQKAVVQFADYDYIFIDTAGRNYREKKYIDDLRGILGKNVDVTTYLVLALSMKEEDAYPIIDNFIPLNIQQFIFTKADETNSFGMMYNIIMKYKIGAAYITAGQDVPDDINPATPKVITKYILRDEQV
ncbi:MAG TPA: flagellar biosynthesis protein FlhF [Bacillaceae bacterium]|nr:flagellar biosynthesis protein FlhF [Bacillaceae bacterium]